MKPAIRAILESKGVSVRSPVHHAVSAAELTIVDGSQHCSVCQRSYRPAPSRDSAADNRCGQCKATLGGIAVKVPRDTRDRVQLTIQRRGSVFDGWPGMGRQVDLPERGWMVRLDLERKMGDHRELFFGETAVRVERRLPALPEGRRPLPVRCQTASMRAGTGKEGPPPPKPTPGSSSGGNGGLVGS